MNEEIFDSYIKNTMSLDERTKFEERLKTDQNFYKEFKEYIYLVSSLKRAARKENNMFGKAFKKITKEQLQSIIQSSDREKEKTHRSFSLKLISTYITSIAAVFALCFWGFSSYYDRMQKYNDLYSNNFNVLSGDYLDSASRGGEKLNEKDSVAFELAKQFYVKNDFEKALKQIERLKDKQPVMQATCLLKLNRADEAVKLLEEEYKKSKDGESGWYLALTYIRKHQKESAVKVLKELGNSDINISEKAMKLRLELEK